ncbi:MAG: HlyD family efflux transporter periplasmic adaptor subunit [Patescibacteria group bacterium]|nr:HlyD family efflux transporter periplasmic adaptor subunit [Patescibacteria group bacterium]
MYKGLIQKLLKRKFILILAAVLLAVSGYFVYAKAYANTGSNKYVVSTVEKGSVINSIAGSGQISTSDQIEIKPKASGNITAIKVTANQEVKKDDIIATIDSRDAQKAVRNAQISLESANLALEKLNESANPTSILQAENALTSAKESLEKLKTTQQENSQNALDAKQNAEDNLATAYEDGFNTISSTFLDLPDIMTGLDKVLNGHDFDSSQTNLNYYSDTINNLAGYDASAEIFRNDASSKYNVAKSAYDKCFTDYKTTNRYSNNDAIDSLINETYDTVKKIAESTKSANNLIQLYKDKLTSSDKNPDAKATSQLSTLSGYTNKTNSELSNLSSAKSSIKQNKDSITNAENNIANMDRDNPGDIRNAEMTVTEKQASLDDLKKGPDALDVRDKKIAIQQRQEDLSDALQTLADYTVRAPVDGVIAVVSAKKNDSASSGTSIATLISKQKIAEVSLGETDIIKIKVGQKASFTFDAIEDLTLTGEVAEVGSMGVSTQGVVSYTVKIVLSSDDDRLKSGMSFSVNIITDSKTDVLVVPTSAIKASGNGSYVLIPDETIADDQLNISTGIILNNSTKQQTVETGLSDGTNTEIISGLNEGDKIITKTIKPTTTTSASTTTTSRNTTQSLIGGAGSFGGGAGGARIPTSGGNASRGN